MQYLLKPFAILFVKYLQYRYRQISTKNRYNQTNQVLAKLMLIQYILYYFKQQFNAWGYFHSSSIWTDEDEIFYNKLFPEKNFEELELLIEYNPQAITYYKNKIWTLNKERGTDYAKEIKFNLKKWRQWN